MSRPVIMPPERRFWPKVDKSGDCWLWTGRLQKDGRGRFFSCHETRIMVFVNRYALELRLKRPIRPGFMSLHTCDVGHCVRNDGDEGTYEVNGVVLIRFGHLFEGTHIDNMADAEAKKRQARGDQNGARLYPERLARGSRNGLAKLTESQVREIRQRVSSGYSGTQAELAAEYGVSGPTMNSLILGKTWQHVDP